MIDISAFSKYAGKKFSVMGDSISTLEGYNPKGYNVYYTKDFAYISGITSPEDTWWGKVIKHLGGTLLVNNSWSGSWVAKLPDRDELFFSGCSDERTSGLHIGSTMPDVIIVYMGTNDWLFGASPEYNGDIQRLKDQSFRYAYNNMLTKLKKNYPEAEIWCCTLCDPGFDDFPFEYHFGIDVYCDIIKEIATKNCCSVADIYPHRVTYDTIDGLHPTAKGMDELAQVIAQEITEQQK